MTVVLQRESNISALPCEYGVLYIWWGNGPSYHLGYKLSSYMYMLIILMGGKEKNLGSHPVVSRMIKWWKLFSKHKNSNIVSWRVTFVKQHWRGLTSSSGKHKIICKIVMNWEKQARFSVIFENLFCYVRPNKKNMCVSGYRPSLSLSHRPWVFYCRFWFFTTDSSRGKMFLVSSLFSLQLILKLSLLKVFL